MKKLLFSLLAMFATALLSDAQPLCGPCQHTVSPQYTYMHVICKSQPIPAWCDSAHVNEEAPALFVIVTYRVVSCPGANDQLLVNGVVLVDDRFHYLNVCGGSIASICGLPDPLSAADILAQLQNGISAAVASLGLTTDIDVIYEGSCNSMVRVEFPEKVYMLQSRGDAPGTDTVWISPESTIWQTLPCNDACCKVKYKFEIVTASNGETLMTWRADSWEGADLSCPNAPMPDYNTSNRRISGFSGTPPATIYPTVMEQTSCSIFCDHMGSPPPPPDVDPGAPGFSTDVAEIRDQFPLRLTAHPTLCSNFIRFTTSKPITKVAVYDMSGKRVMHTTTLTNNELITSELKNGIYYVQVYFSENEVKTIMIMKQ
ncbi:MAG: T9SS type A sorting domain-containing protein [Bacteroidota bacterium]